MIKLNFRKILLNFIIILAIFFLDRVSKNYILNIAAINSTVDIYVNSYLNLYLIWNKGIAFGLLSFDKDFIYNSITVLIITVTIIILVMIIRSNDFKRYFLAFIFSGSLGNIYDRLYYSAVPDFIDFHVNNFHWFVFNVADIFISLGILCLIITEIFFNKSEKNEIN